MRTDPITVTGTDVKAEEHLRDELAGALAKARQARTPLGRRLWEIRARIVASGVPLLSWDEIDQEVAERRGGCQPDDE